MTITRRDALRGAAALGAAIAAPGLLRAAGYPDRPVTFVVPWGAGGGTDATARIVGALLEKKFGQPFNVVNRTGGSGVVGHSAIATAAPDGYTIGMVTVEIAMMRHQGLTDLSHESYAPLSLMNADPAGVTVQADGPHGDIAALVAAIKASAPGSMKASGTGQGGIWHLALVAMLQEMGLAPNHVAWVPSEGAAPAMQDLAAGGVDFVTCSLPEARSMIDAGRARGLAVMAPERHALFPDLPTLKEAAGVAAEVGAWRGICAPKGTPAEIVDTLAAALAEVAQDPEFTGFMSGRGFGVRYMPPAEHAAFMASEDAAMAKAMQAAGLARG
jgi:tripartite-type tricarboxylate transporter receptor subunit TctC